MFFKSLWLRLPEHVRRGLTRLYLVVSVPWVAWFGYGLFDAFQQGDDDLASNAFWSLLIVPIGAPIVAFAVLWVVVGFWKREPAPTGKDDGSNPPNPWGRPAEKPVGPSLHLGPRTKHYYAIIEHAVSQLENKDSQSRETLYAQARTILDQKLQGQPDWDAQQERKAFEKAIRDFEGFKKYIHEFAVEPEPASTAGLILSIYFLKGLWMLDATSMSLYWVARLPKPSK